MDTRPTLPPNEQDPAKSVWSCLHARSNRGRFTSAKLRKLDGVTVIYPRTQGAFVAFVDPDLSAMRVRAPGRGAKACMFFLDRKVKSKLNSSRGRSQAVHPLAV